MCIMMIDDNMDAATCKCAVLITFIYIAAPCPRHSLWVPAWQGPKGLTESDTHQKRDLVRAVAVKGCPKIMQACDSFVGRTACMRAGRS